MASIDLAATERRVRLSYEWARTRRALLGFAPALGIIAVAAAFGRRPSAALAFGGALFVLGAGLLWYGRDLKRAVLPGLLAGLVPLTLVLCASHVDHVCTTDGLHDAVFACVRDRRLHRGSHGRHDHVSRRQWAATLRRSIGDGAADGCSRLRLHRDDRTRGPRHWLHGGHTATRRPTAISPAHRLTLASDVLALTWAWIGGRVVVRSEIPVTRSPATQRVEPRRCR